MRGGRRGLWGITAIVLGIIILLALIPAVLAARSHGDWSRGRS